ncbi:MAG: hypothetical protein KF912_13245 [Phycisphaeraceae bacterium]|nr:hypothetical protein [Phycisphaeraceae bacterium]MBX3368271.1 hypothetical protein [Phycisphaeraceae bacterium]
MLATLVLTAAAAQTKTVTVETNAVTILLIIGSFFAFWILLATIDSIHKTNQRERTAREIAAYVAEGSISAADAGHMLESQNRAKLRERLAELVAEQWIDTETAEKIMGDGVTLSVHTNLPRSSRTSSPDAAVHNA